MIYHQLFVIFSLLASLIQCDEFRDPHQHFVQKGICEMLSESRIDKFNSGMKLKCDWSRFRDENNNLIASRQSYQDSRLVYEIIFIPSVVPANLEKYKIINAGLFSNFRLKSLSFQNLGIVTIETGAFDNFCCENTLVTLDLSKNHLIRLEKSSLMGLGRLARLNLNTNYYLSLCENNFQLLRNLKYLDLSQNNIQYLPSRLFGGLTELELVNLDANNLRSVEACTFDLIQASKLSRNLFPANINLTNNPIHCDCDLFFLARYRGYKVEANCISPSFYNDKPFSTLVKEDPSARCDYSAMANSCRIDSSTSWKVATIILSILFGLFFLCCLVCCCKFMSASDRAEQLQIQINKMRAPKESNSSKWASSDKAKLLA